jgi:hypothetical protein
MRYLPEVERWIRHGLDAGELGDIAPEIEASMPEVSRARRAADALRKRGG